MNHQDETLYHYCSIEGLFHIINTKSIWLTNSSHMNDSLENSWIENYFEIIKDYFKNDEYKKFLINVFDIYKLNNHPPFIFCLSKEKDQLSQWRAYSQDGHGVSIGFNTKFLSIENSIPSPNIYAYHTLGYYKVEYSKTVQQKTIMDICESIKNDFDTKKYDKISISLEFISNLVHLSIVFKNPSFMEEREWRIIHTPLDKYEKPDLRLSELKFRIKQKRITPYYNLNFGSNFNSQLISEIVLGPKCEMTAKEIKQFLRHNNLDKTKITTSKSSYK